MESFGDADHLILTDIYPAGEDPIEGISSQVLRDSLADRGQKDVFYLPAFDDIVEHLVSVVQPTDVVLTLGAGSVWKIGEALAERLKSITISEG
jgi:UDP-N-acetylmuramate--alanine ligase